MNRPDVPVLTLSYAINLLVDVPTYWDDRFSPKEQERLIASICGGICKDLQLSYHIDRWGVDSAGVEKIGITFTDSHAFDKLITVPAKLQALINLPVLDLKELLS